MKPLTDVQLSLMRVLWRRGEATVAEVHEGLAEQRSLAPTTVATMLKRLEKHGFVAHRTEGRQFVYHAVVSEDAVRASMVDALTEGLFEGDATAFVSHLLDVRSFSAEDLERVRRLLSEKTGDEDDDER